ncbi:cell wall-binding repeat-containing protein [Planococcus shenhongbingii]|uniref:S8 family serine peptidase n=1 Tax=Planococcus shenhongbingii TaxID=3058398 RepID=A0ABT8NCB4_9BACL|nr:cell wall-binding repeat-containing protein [Planococcus sp. N017]MDN7245546.1 S8 family serine peptidase [Planococcus sp. N017]
MDRAFKIMISFMMALSIFGILPAVNTVDAEDVLEAAVLEEETEVADTFSADATERWYKIDVQPDQIEQHSHFEISLQSNKELTFSVYSSAERAASDQTFDFYRNYSFKDKAASVQFPISWEGPYYVKISSYSEEPADETQEKTDIDYTLSFKGKKMKASQIISNEQCPAELVLDGKNVTEKDLLDNLRAIRSEVLSQTESGKELTKLYYKVAPFIGYQAITNASVKESLSRNLKQLEGLVGKIAKDGFYSSAVITAAEQKAIIELYELSLKTAPEKLRSEIKQAGDAIGIYSLANRSVLSVMVKTNFVKQETNSNRVIVKLKEGTSLTKAETSSIGIHSVSEFETSSPKFDQFQVMDLTAGMSASKVNQTVQVLESMPEVEFIEPVQEYTLQSTDIYKTEQWSLSNAGEGFGIKGADIRYKPMLDLIQKKEMTETVTAVLDTGVDYTLADLQHQMVDTGYDFINDDRDAFDDEGHGTHVAGIIAAESGNDYSMTGINQFTKILPVKVLDEGGSGDTEKIAYGIIYAADQGADIINMSLGGGYSRMIEYALKYAHDRGVTIIVSSGNEGSEEVAYPASSKYTISVGATNRLDLVSDYSNYGKALDLVAPGTDIPSLVPNGNMTLMTGTSMAAPHVTGVAGLLKSLNPSLSPEQIRTIVTASADDVAFTEEDRPDYLLEDPYLDEEYPYAPDELAPGFDLVSGWGRLNAEGSIHALSDKWNSASRISGASRYETAVNVSKKGWLSSEKVVLAAGGDFPDALSAAPLAAYYDAPLLLTKTAALPAAVKDELMRLKAKEVILIGGNSAISPLVEKELVNLGIAQSKIKRISGTNRYATSANIAKAMTGTTEAVIANGANFADALSMASIAGNKKMPILLTKSNALPSEVKAHLSSKAYKKTYIIGGKGAISDATAKGIRNSVRIAGSSRYETNSAVIEYFKGSLDSRKMYLSNGTNFPDALAGSVMAARQKAPLILTSPKALNPATVKTVQTQLESANEIYILGGEGAMPTSSIKQLFE